MSPGRKLIEPPRTLLIQKNGSDLLTPISGGSATAFSAYKVSAKNGLFLGQMTVDTSRYKHGERCQVLNFVQNTRPGMITYEKKVESEMLAQRKTFAAVNSHGKIPEKTRIYLME